MSSSCLRGKSRLWAEQIHIDWISRTTIVYDPIACSTWNPSGWSYKLGGLDYAGGTPVHIASGCTALAYSLLLGDRKGYRSRPHNVSMVVIGTVWLWVGWMGFNGGSALGANLRAAVALMNTNLCATVSGITWCFMDLYCTSSERISGASPNQSLVTKSWSVVGFCMGVISGCVAITPGAGYVPVWSAVIFGIVGGFLSHLATKLKHVMAIDDALDIFAVHTISGFTGNILTGKPIRLVTHAQTDPLGFFAADYIAHLDGVTVIKGGVINGHGMQVAYQLADSLAGGAYSFVVSLVLLLLISKLPYCHLRIESRHELPTPSSNPYHANSASAPGGGSGVDKAEIGELMYDFVEANTDVTQLNRLEDSLSLLAEKITALVNARAMRAHNKNARTFETMTTVSAETDCSKSTRPEAR